MKGASPFLQHPTQWNTFAISSFIPTEIQHRVRFLKDDISPVLSQRLWIDYKLKYFYQTQVPSFSCLVTVGSTAVSIFVVILVELTNAVSTCQFNKYNYKYWDGCAVYVTQASLCFANQVAASKIFVKVSLYVFVNVSLLHVFLALCKPEPSWSLTKISKPCWKY